MSDDKGYLAAAKDKVVGAVHSVKDTIVGATEPPVEQRGANHVKEFAQGTADRIGDAREKIGDYKERVILR